MAGRARALAGTAEGVSRLPTRATEELLARYHEIDRLEGLTWDAPEMRRWQAATVNALRQSLGFHPAVVEFQGLRFRAGPVHVASREELSGIPREQHDVRLRADLAEAKALLGRALTVLGLDPRTAPPAVPAEPGAGGAVAEAIAAQPGLSEEARARGLQAAAAFAGALHEARPEWSRVAPALLDLLRLGLPVARAALADLAPRLGDLR